MRYNDIDVPICVFERFYGVLALCLCRDFFREPAYSFSARFLVVGAGCGSAHCE